MCYDIDRISEVAQLTGMLPEANELRSLGLWIWWLTLKYEDVFFESQMAVSATLVPFRLPTAHLTLDVAQLSKVNRMLRPFAFASFGVRVSLSRLLGPLRSHPIPLNSTHSFTAHGHPANSPTYDPGL